MCHPRAILIVLVSSAVTVASSQEPSASSRLTSEEILAAFPDAGTKAGVWLGHGVVVATGVSPSIENFDENKNRRIENQFAIADAKGRIMKEMANGNFPEYDPATHDLEGTFREMVTLRSDIHSKGGVMATVSLPLSRLVVSVKYNVKKAREHGAGLFDSRDWSEAALVFARLTQEGVQDPETIALALAASAHVNLEIGVNGERRFEALERLGEFYLSKGKPEESIKYYFQIYSECAKPNKALLQRLISLCELTNRPDNGRLFAEELSH